MKRLMTLLLILLNTSIFAAENFELRFWDGTFAYNQLIVKSNPHQDNIMQMELSGAQIGLGAQIDGLPTNGWGYGDKVQFSILKKDCLLDVEGKSVKCELEKLYVNNITWVVNHRLSKTLTGTVVKNVSIVATKSEVSIKFTIPSDDQFTPHQNDIEVQFRSLDF